jgi:hypothetical protein
LGEEDVHGLVFGNFLIELIGIVNRAVPDAGGATRAFFFYDVSGLFGQGNIEVPGLAFDDVNFSISQDLDIWMPADLDQFRRKYSHGTVIGGKGLVELGHMAADARSLFHQVDLKPGNGQIKSGLDTADASTDDHDVAKADIGGSIQLPSLNEFIFHCFLSSSGFHGC